VEGSTRGGSNRGGATPVDDLKRLKNQGHRRGEVATETIQKKQLPEASRKKGRVRESSLKNGKRSLSSKCEEPLQQRKNFKPPMGQEADRVGDQRPAGLLNQSNTEVEWKN